MNLQLEHYASGFYARISVLGAMGIAVLANFALPDEVLNTVSGVVKNLWVVLGPIGAFAIQMALQLMSLGEHSSLTDVQLRRLSALVNQRLRYIWDFTAVTLLALALSMSMSALNPSVQTQRLAIAVAIGLLALTGFLALRFPFLFREIKDFRWRIANERRTAEERAAAIKELKTERAQPLPDIPEPTLRNGTH